jgi:chemotaxis protein CheX
MNSLGMDTAMHERLVSEICLATESVLSTMMGLASTAGTANPESPGPGPIGGVSAMVGIVGPWAGAGVVSCNERMACKLAGAMLLSEYDTVNEDVLDALGEVANMIIGNVKTNLEPDLGTLALGVPTVTFGKDFATRSTMKQAWTMVPFYCDGEKLIVQVLLAQTSQHPHLIRAPHHRTLVEA